MNVTALARKNLDPERAALREKIADAAAARKKVTATEAAVERAGNLVSGARRKFEVASKAVAAARDEDAQQLAAAITSGETVSPQAARRAREAEIEAGDDIAMARAAYAQLEADLKDAEREVEGAGKAVNVAVAAVLKPVAERMIEQADRARSQYITKMYALSAMVDAGVGGKCLLFEITDAEHRRLSASVGQTWRAAIEALKTDSDSPLPALGD
jgi:hypothetical protein